MTPTPTPTPAELIEKIRIGLEMAFQPEGNEAQLRGMQNNELQEVARQVCKDALENVENPLFGQYINDAQKLFELVLSAVQKAYAKGTQSIDGATK